MDEGLLTSVDAGIANITIDRPNARNAMTGDIIRAMANFCQSVEHDASVRVISINGTGDHFMAGGDVKSFADALEQTPQALRLDFERRSTEAMALWITLERMPQPVVVSVRGFAAGAALSLVAGADFAIASETAKFLMAQVHLGLVPDAATTYHLPRTIGLRRAKRLAYLGDRIDAEEALSIGLVTQVVADDALEATTRALLERLTAAPFTAISASKRILNASLGNTIAQQITLEGQAVGICGASADLREGVLAFVEKRRPRFSL